VFAVTRFRHLDWNHVRRILVLCLSASALTRATWAHADATSSCPDAATQGQILRDADKLVEARKQFLICAQEGCPRVVRMDCAVWLEQVQAILPTVVPIAVDEAGNSLPGVKVSMDGKLLFAKIDGRSVELNPGTYTFTFEAPDGTKAEKEIVVANGEKNRRVTATIAKPAANATAVAPAPPPPPSKTNGSPPQPTPATTPAERTRPASSGPWKAAGIVTTGVGVVGLGIGTVFGVTASNKKSEANCASSGLCPTPDAVNKQKDAQNAGNLATVFFAAGAVLAAAGVTMFVFAPEAPVQVAPSVGIHSAGVVWRGAF
jgi:hypothetical protein